MNTVMARLQGDSSSFNHRVKGMLPFYIASVFHALLLLAFFLSMKAPPIGRAARAVEISLIPGTGALTALTPAPTPTLLKSASPVPSLKAPPTPPPAQPQAMIQAPPTPNRLTPPPAPVDLAPLVTKLSSGGPSLTAAPVSVSAPATEATTTASQIAGGKSCQITATLQASLRGGQEAKMALSRIPAASRSVANAILLWDGRWIDQSSVGGAAAFEPVERAIVDAINQAPAACQTELIHGVRFVILADARDTMVLAFGSGEWRWMDVAATFSTVIPE